MAHRVAKLTDEHEWIESLSSATSSRISIGKLCVVRCIRSSDNQQKGKQRGTPNERHPHSTQAQRPHLHVGQHNENIHPLCSDAGKRGAQEAPAEPKDEEPVDKHVPDVGEHGNVHGGLDHALRLGRAEEHVAGSVLKSRVRTYPQKVHFQEVARIQESGDNEK